MASPALTSEKFTWTVIGIATAVALFATYKQLEAYKKRTVVKDSASRSVGVEQSTEDAIKLSTLEALATGVNPELRSAALTIITERALRRSSLDYICGCIEGDDQQERLKALKAFTVLVQHVSTRRFLSSPGIFRALVHCLQKNSALPAQSPLRRTTEREALGLVARFVETPAAQAQLVEAGLAEWLKARRDMDAPASGDNPLPQGRDEGLDPDSNLYALLRALRENGDNWRDALLDPSRLGGRRRWERQHGDLAGGWQQVDATDLESEVSVDDMGDLDDLDRVMREALTERPPLELV